MYICYIMYHLNISEVGGGESNREIVSFRSCMSAQLYVRSEWISKFMPRRFFLFPFGLRWIQSLSLVS